MIFVFGSNLAGIHGAGAARFAFNHRGATWGVGQGLQGDSYALPTKDKNIRTLSIDQVYHYVQNFLDYVTFDRPELEYQVTCIGCGLAGFTDKQIAPMFKSATENCLFDDKWRPFLGGGHRYWGTF